MAWLGSLLRVSKGNNVGTGQTELFSRLSVPF